MHEVACACIFTATKLNDTQKRVYDVVLASYALRYPDLLTPPPGAASGDWIAHATVSEMDMDMDAIQQEQTRLVSLERLLLQSICFRFEPRSPSILRWTIKVARHWQRRYRPLTQSPDTMPIYFGARRAIATAPMRPCYTLLPRWPVDVCMRRRP